MYGAGTFDADLAGLEGLAQAAQAAGGPETAPEAAVDGAAGGEPAAQRQQLDAARLASARLIQPGSLQYSIPSMWPKGAGAPKKPRLAELRAEIKRRDATARPSYWSEPQCYQWLMAHAIPDEAATADAAAAAPAPAPAAAAAPAPAAAPGAAPVTEDEAAPAAKRWVKARHLTRLAHSIVANKQQGRLPAAQCAAHTRRD